MRPPHRVAAGPPLTSAPQRPPILLPRPFLNTAETTAPRRHLKYRIKNPETPDSPPHSPESPPLPHRQSPPSRPPATPPRDRARPAPAAAARPRTRPRDSGAAGAPIPGPLGRAPPAARQRGWLGSPNPEPARGEGPLIGWLYSSERPVARTCAPLSIKGKLLRPLRH